MYGLIGSALLSLLAALGSLLTPAPAPTAEPRYAPPAVKVDPAVRGVDAADVRAVVTGVVNDSRSWAVDFDHVIFRIVPLATVQEVCGEGAGACAGGWMGDVVIMSGRDWKKLWPHAPKGVTLADQRAWYINHELGHLLGLGHVEHCPADEPAPVMRPYAYGGGCEFNAWPALGGEV